MYQLFETAQLGPMTLRNRIIRSATNEHLSQRDGGLTAQWAQAQAQLAGAGVGLVITGHLTVERKQRADEGQPVLDAQTDKTLLAACVRMVHEQGGRIAAQLSHSGLKAARPVNGLAPKAPADFTQAELKRLTEQFCTAARLCQDAGFDGVQVHSAHGYLLSNFLTPDCNKRSDAYGGSLNNRFRLIDEILAEIRRHCGRQFALLVKADSDASGDLHKLLKCYEEAGVDGVELSGLDVAQRKGERKPFYLSCAAKAGAGISLPLIPVGGVFDRDSAQQVLDAGFPFVSLSRSLICQPDFVRRLERGEPSACIACNQCYTIYRSAFVRCIQHHEVVPQLKAVFQTDQNLQGGIP